MVGEPEESKADDRLALVLDESLRALTQQQQVLDGLRTRIAAITAAAGVALSVFAKDALQPSRPLPPRVLALVGVVAFVGILCAAVYINWPAEWNFRSSARKLLDTLKDHNLDSIRRNLASEFEGYVDENDDKLKNLQKVFVGAMFSLLLQVIVLSVSTMVR